MKIEKLSYSELVLIRDALHIQMREEIDEIMEFYRNQNEKLDEYLAKRNEIEGKYKELGEKINNMMIESIESSE